MTLFDFEKQEQGDWFAFFESHIDTASGEIVYDSPVEGAAEFRIRSMAPFWEERRKGRKRESKMVLNPSTRSMERVTWIEDLPIEDAEKESEEAWDYAITGIKNAFGPDGEAIDCTRENKMKLIKIPKFVRFVSRVFQLLNDAGVREREDQEKNLSRPQSG